MTMMILKVMIMMMIVVMYDNIYYIQHYDILR